MHSRRSVVLIACAFGLAGCGFRPLYANRGSADGSLDLSAVSVEEQQTRPGQLVRNELLRVMSSGPARYSLRFRLEVRNRQKSSLPRTSTSRFDLTLDAKYDLIDATTQKSVDSGRTFSMVSYDVVRQPVADRRAADAAESRAAIEIANDIRLRVAVWLAKLHDSRSSGDQ